MYRVRMRHEHRIVLDQCLTEYLSLSGVVVIETVSRQVTDDER